MSLGLTPEQIQDLAAEIVIELRENAFDGDRWINNPKGVHVVAGVLAGWKAPIRDQILTPLDEEYWFSKY
jgi:hypothetical protein